MTRIQRVYRWPKEDRIQQSPNELGESLLGNDMLVKESERGSQILTRTE